MNIITSMFIVVLYFIVKSHKPSIKSGILNNPKYRILILFIHIASVTDALVISKYNNLFNNMNNSIQNYLTYSLVFGYGLLIILFIYFTIFYINILTGKQIEKNIYSAT